MIQINAKNSNSALLILITLWLGWTLLIDFVVIPTTFSTVENFFNAGDLGIALFTQLNTLEVIVSGMIVVLIVFQLKSIKYKHSLIQLFLALILWAIGMYYFYYLTPKITSLTVLWKKSEMLGQIKLGDITDVQQEHQFFHRLYIGIDTFKIVLLAGLLSLTVWNREKSL